MNDEEDFTSYQRLRQIAHRLSNYEVRSRRSLLARVIGASRPSVREYLDEAISIAGYELGEDSYQVRRLISLRTRSVADASEAAIELWCSQIISCISDAMTEIHRNDWRLPQSDGDEETKYVATPHDHKTASIAYVSESRIEALRALPASDFDVKRLIRMLEELS